jgi:hypothetical protein
MKHENTTDNLSIQTHQQEVHLHNLSFPHRKPAFPYQQKQLQMIFKVLQTLLHERILLWKTTATKALWSQFLSLHFYLSLPTRHTLRGTSALVDQVQPECGVIRGRTQSLCGLSCLSSIRPQIGIVAPL